MEPPYKRQRIGVTDPNLKRRRARNDFQLKSIFESIFDKYSKDFEGIGDEIDLRTGEIVVNNGHILSLNHETDTGQVDSSSNEGGYTYSREGERIEDYDQTLHEGTVAADGSVISEADSRSQARYVVDSIIESIEVNPSSISFGESLHGQIADYNSEEDELADRAVEWVTPREVRAIAHKKWQLPVSGPTFGDESAIEEAWRAPPLSDSSSPAKSAGPSPAPLIAKLSPVPKPSSSILSYQRRARYDAHQPNCDPVIPAEVPQTAGLLDKVKDSGIIKSDDEGGLWTREEIDHLCHLKATTQLTYREMAQFFPRRTRHSLAIRWSLLVKSDSNLIMSVKSRHKRRSSLPSNTTDRNPVSARKNQPPERVVDQGARDSATNVSWSSPKLIINSPEKSTHCPNNGESTLRPGGSLEKSRKSPLECQRQSSKGLKDDRLGAQDLGRALRSAVKKNLRVSKVFGDEDPSQYHPTALGDEQVQTSQLSLSFRKDAARRKRKSIKNLDPTIFEITPSAASSLPHHLAESSILVKPGHEAEARSSSVNDSKSETGEIKTNRTALSTKTLSKAPAETSLPYPVTGTIENESSCSMKTRRAMRALRRKHLLLGTSSEEKSLVQVVVPQPRQYEIPVPVTQPGSLMREQSFVESPCHPAHEEYIVVPAISSEFDRASPTREGPVLEIPDSQPATSSPPANGDNGDQNTNYAHKNRQPISPISSIASPLSLGPICQASKDVVDESELIDELSIVCQPSKKKSRKSISSIKENVQIKDPITLSASRSRRSLKIDTSKTGNANTILFIPTDLHDYSEDELSFM